MGYGGIILMGTSWFGYMGGSDLQVAQHEVEMFTVFSPSVEALLYTNPLLGGWVFEFHQNFFSIQGQRFTSFGICQ